MCNFNQLISRILYFLLSQTKILVNWLLILKTCAYNVTGFFKSWIENESLMISLGLLSKGQLKFKKLMSAKYPKYTYSLSVSYSCFNTSHPRGSNWTDRKKYASECFFPPPTLVEQLFAASLPFTSTVVVCGVLEPFWWNHQRCFLKKQVKHYKKKHEQPPNCICRTVLLFFLSDFPPPKKWKKEPLIGQIL